MNSSQQQPEQTRTDRNLGHSSFSSDGLDLPRLGLVLVYSVCSWLTRGRVMAAFGSVLANSSGPPQCHHPTCYVGWMRMFGTIWLSGIRSDMNCFSFRYGLVFQYEETFAHFLMFYSVIIHNCRCILATDMTRHNEILNKFKSILSAFDFTSKEHREVVRGEQM